MQKGKKDDVFIKQPYFEGGPKALTTFIQSQIVYPQDALSNKTKGVVELNITINHLGAVTESVVLKSLGNGCDEEAQRIAKLIKFVVPKNPRKLKVLFHKNLRVTFNLPKTKTQPTPNNVIQYNYTITQAPSKSIPQSSKYSYNIVIKKG
ncbi:MAG TPA: energy transducer TonB [Saprospiraceae bacterium]|nr:energy transducer TonB [Saprospiraceae bacterium]HPN69707.1 energy transducer TonB [Saprospiraceae bacterium]